MNEQNRRRLGRIAARHASRAAQGPSEPEAKQEDAAGAAFLAAFDRVRDDVLRPVMAEVGVQLRGAGYLFRITAGGEEGSPAVDFHVILPDRGDSKDTVRFFAHKDSERGWQVIGELELKRSPIELTRFEAMDQITHDVVEQLVVDAVEQMLASTGDAPRSKSPVPAPTPAPAPAPTPPASTRPPAPAPLVSRAPTALTGTSMGFVEPKGPTLPFTPGAATAPPTPAASTPASAPIVTHASGALSAALMATLTPKGPALPLASGRLSRNASPWAADVRGTLDGVAAGPVAVLPFDPHAPSTLPASGGPRLARSGADLGGTLDPTPGPARPALPFAATPEPIPPTGLSLEQYASLCVELADEPARSGDILRRYRVIAEQQKELDDYWQARMAADPSLWSAFNRACGSYKAWLTSTRQK